MQAILGIDAAWTEREPSGVALVEGAPGAWRAVSAAPSYEAFVAGSRGAPVEWHRSKFIGCWPRMQQLIEAAQRMTAADLSVVALDMPVANVPFESRRAADTAVSKAFGGRGCGTHSPSSVRPGSLGRSLMGQLQAQGFPLATTAALDNGGPCTLEVYPHTAVLALLPCEYRLPYKVSRSIKYWPGTSVGERVSRILSKMELINTRLAAVFGDAPVPLPHAQDVATLGALKKYEDVLDALVCAWVGVRFAEGAARAYGDEAAAIWVPEALKATK